MHTYEAFLACAVRAAKAAGAVLEDYVGRFSVREKGRADLVTSADLAAQQAVRTVIADAFPDHDFLGEEGDARPSGRSGHRWIVDPLDGTTNYVHGIPFYCTSVALEINGEVAVGAVHDPNLDECFTAARGGGAELNGTPIRVSEIDTLAQSVVATGFPTDVGLTRVNLQSFAAMVLEALSVRRMGSAALNLAYVACGRFAGAWATSLNPWDMAAGVLLVREAGGVVTDLTGAPFDLYKPTLLSTNGHVHEAMLGVLKPTAHGPRPEGRG